MDKTKLLHLIQKYLKGKASTEDKQKLDSWYAMKEGETNYTDGLTEDAKQGLRNKMLRNIIDSSDIYQRSNSEEKVSFRIWKPLLAATVSLLLIGFSFYIWMENQMESYRTAYGEHTTITLPDLSVVTLNGNSALQYAKHWNEGENREVWLDGDAFFSVTHQENKQKFLVHTSATFSVEVLGTEFSVSKRKAATSVALKSGSVKLHLSSPLENNNAEELLMKPGEVVELNNETRALHKSQEKDLGKYYAWKQNKLILENTDLEEIINMLENTYGIKIHLEDKALLKRSATGSLPLPKERDQLLANITVLFDLIYEDQSDYILLKEK